VRELFGDRVDLRTMERGTLEVTAFGSPQAFADHFRTNYGPTIAARKNAAKDGREGDLDAALDDYMASQDLGGGRFEAEYLIIVGTRR
jgi:hypothetical protein